MRQITTTLYQFHELSEESQQTAIEHARSKGWGECGWLEEWRESLEAAAKTLEFFSISNWQIDGRGYSTWATVEIRDDDLIFDLKGFRAFKWLLNNGIPEKIGIDGLCPFTGFCGDEAFLLPLRAFLTRPWSGPTLEELMQECADSWARAVNCEIEYAISDEAIAESLQANEVEFTEDGQIY